MSARLPVPENAPVLEAKSLTRHYAVARGWMKPKATLRALDGVSFELQAARTLAVVGESGCGKSTLARQLTFIETPTSGELIVCGTNLTRAGARERRTARPLVQMVFQNPYASLNPRKKIGAILDEPLRINTALSSAERAVMVRAMLARVGLRDDSIDRYPHMFSGGQRQRVAIARALILQPRVIVADEPVSALDVSIQAQVLNLLMDLRDATGVAFVFISHNLSVVRHIADDVLVMYLGRTVEQGGKARIFDTPAHPYTRALLAATPILDAPARREKIVLRGELPSPLHPPAGCAFHLRCPHAQERCVKEQPVLRVVMDRQVACHRAEELMQGCGNPIW
jgi:dipeptide transport system ATP-binding protein